jgi:hypothetical protein
MDSRIMTIKSQLQSAQGEQSTDRSLQGIHIAEDGLVHHDDKLYVPDALLKDILTYLHKAQGHSAFVPLFASFLKVCYHPHARAYAKKLVNSCASCNTAKPSVGAATSYGPVRKPPYPFETVGIDLFGPLSRRSGRNTGCYILTVVDRLTGYTIFAVIDNGRADTIVRWYEIFLLTLGQRIKYCVTDNGPQFVSSAEFSSLLATWGIQHLRIPIYTPTAGGFYETKHRTAVHVLRTMLIDNPFHQWQFIASLAAQQINSRVSPDRTSSPHELLFGWEYIHPSVFNMVEPTPLIDVDSGIADPLLTPLVHEESRKRHERRTELLRIWHHEFDLRQNQAAERFEATIPKSRVPLATGDKVMFANDVIKRKMQDQASGPFILSQQLGAHTWKVTEEGSSRTFIFHDRRLRKIEDSSDLPELLPPLIPSIASNGDSSSQVAPHTIIPSIVSQPTHHRPRQDREESFLQSISGPSRSGRVRRGSMNRKIL